MPLRHPDGRLMTPDEIAESKCDFSDICPDPKPRMTLYGEQDDNGIDVSLIRENLKLTPLERIRRADALCRQTLELQEYGRRARANRL